MTRFNWRADPMSSYDDGRRTVRDADLTLDAIADALRDRGPMTTGQISGVLRSSGVRTCNGRIPTAGNISHALKRLVDEGTIEADRTGRPIHWRLRRAT